MGPLTLTPHPDRASLLAAAGAWLEAHEAEHNLLLGVLGGAAPGVDVLLAHATRGGAVELVVALPAPPRGLMLSRTELPDAVPLLLDALAARGIGALPAVSGPADVAAAFADAWRARTGASPSRVMEQRIYALTAVVPPRPAPGSFRVATDVDLDLVCDWAFAFATEADVMPAQRDGVIARARQQTAAGNFFLWDDGGPASMAGTARLTRHGAVVSTVYTPPALRGRGYASSCVAAWSARQLAAGRRFCCLYADKANPTSNGIYAAMGYAPVADAVHFSYDAPP